MLLILGKEPIHLALPIYPPVTGMHNKIVWAAGMDVLTFLTPLQEFQSTLGFIHINIS